LPSTLHGLTTGSVLLGQPGPTEEVEIVPVITLANPEQLSIRGYQWQSSLDGQTWDDILNATNEAFTPDDAQVALEAGNIAILGGRDDVARTAWRAAVKNGGDRPAGKAAADALARLDSPKP
jgi:hypothetical protein